MSRAKNITIVISFKILYKTDILLNNNKTDMGVESKLFHFISSSKYIFLSLSQMIALYCQNTLTILTLRCRSSFKDVYMGQMYVISAGTTQDNFNIPEPRVRGLPISQDRLDRMKFDSRRTIPII